jgi:hypothetical protein
LWTPVKDEKYALIVIPEVEIQPGFIEFNPEIGLEGTQQYDIARFKIVRPQIDTRVGFRHLGTSKASTKRLLQLSPCCAVFVPLASLLACMPLNDHQCDYLDYN